jgi:hypothetical protein
VRKKPVDLGAVRKARASLAKIAEDFPELRTPSSRGNRTVWETALEDEIMATKKTAQDEQIVVRLPKPLLERVDAYAERLRAEQPGPAWRRSDVVRLLMARALDDADKSAKAKKK